MKTNFKLMAGTFALALLSACGGGNLDEAPMDASVGGSVVDASATSAPVAMAPTAPVMVVDTHTPAGTLPPDLPTPPVSAMPCSSEVCLQTPHTEMAYMAAQPAEAGDERMYGVMSASYAQERPYPDLSDLPMQAPAQQYGTWTAAR